MLVTETRKVLFRLLERYNRHKEDKGFMGNEKQACRSLIEPFIHKVLGWDVEDPSEFHPEESKSGKRIDYVVYNQGISQFIIEAKALNKDIFNNFQFYKQALEYGYSKDHDFAILTNFRQIVILACKINVRVVGNAEIARIDLTKATDEDLTLLLSFEKDYWLSSGKNNNLFAKLANNKSREYRNEKFIIDFLEKSSGFYEERFRYHMGKMIELIKLNFTPQ